MAALVGLAIGLIGLAVAIGAWLLPNSDDDPPPVNNSINGNCNAQGSSNTVACSGIPSSPKK
ncbi:hypothetical protein [Actinomadura roseirufa]|uniref:hypothetical protein n=1 Tax=Actinomadura roseirufa TaxID=2094049 RepID=UPI001041A93F|nr:hypothetical protein [Actinomadura roseirufa]